MTAGGSAAAGQTDSGVLGLARVAEEPSVEPVEAVGGGDEDEAFGIADDDARSLRADFDDAGLRNGRASVADSGPITGVGSNVPRPGPQAAKMAQINDFQAQIGLSGA
jgi:hypothetical protein